MTERARRIEPLLLLLALRRGFGLPWLLVAAAAAGLARVALVVRDDTALAGLLAPAAHESLARHGAWCAVLVCFVPFSAWLAARAASDLRRDDGELLLGGGSDPWRVGVSQWCGHALAAAATFALFAVYVEAQAGSDIRLPRTLAGAETPRDRWVDAQGLDWDIGDAQAPPADARTLRLPLGLGAGSGATAEVELVLRNRAGATTSGRARIALQGEVVAPLPEGGPVAARVRCLEPQARVWLLGGAGWEGAPEPPAAAGVEIALRGLLAVCALLGVAWGFGMWLRPALATLLATLAWAALAFGPEPAWLAGARLGSALFELRSGRVPCAVEVWDVADALVLAAAGLATGLLALRGGRGAR